MSSASWSPQLASLQQHSHHYNIAEQLQYIYFAFKVIILHVLLQRKMLIACV